MSFIGSDDLGSSTSASDLNSKELEEFLMWAKQKARLDAQVHKFNDFCWDTCVEKPGSKIDGKTAACLSNCVDRFIDVTLFVTNRFQQVFQKNGLLI